VKRRRATAAPARRTGAKGVTFAPAGASWSFVPAGTKFNYAAEVGSGLGSSVLVSLLCWLMRTFPEAPAVVERREQEQWRMVWNHGMAAKIRNPNPFYSGRVLWMATVMDFAFGNAYWIKVRNGFGDVEELWWAPAALMKPIYGPQWPDTFIHHYEYRGYVDGQPRNLDPRDVVHFRFGLHPENQRLGYTPLAAMVREIYVDDQASNFTASILRNLGVIGVVVSPAAGEKIPPEKVTETKEYLQQNFSGDKRGQGLVFSRPTDVKVLSYQLQGFDVGPIRDIAEERLSAALGIPAAVVGFGTGLQQTKVGATMRELIGQAWNGCIMPMQAILGEELDRSLLIEFQDNTSIFRSQFDTSDVRALREDEQQRAERVGKLAAGGILRLDEARRELGFEVRDEHKVYYRPSNVTAVKTPGEKPEPAATPPLAPGDNGAPGGADALTGAKSATLALPAPAPSITVNVPEQPAPIVNITNQMPDQPAPVVNVDVKVPDQPAPVINIPESRPIVKVDVAAPPPAEVTVSPTVIVQAPSAEAVRIERDAQGRPKRIVREG
jgi:phage portal protein BeeE